MESLKPRGYSALLQNRPFLALWMAQILSNTALNGSFFLQLILIEQVTGSSGQLAAVILAFSLPAVLLSALAGIVVDRISKKNILFASNALRAVSSAALTLLAAFMLMHRLNDALFLVELYILVFLISAIGQFFAPAEGATIPLLVHTGNLLPANSLFTITFTASQVLGLVILAPLGAKVLGIIGSLWVATGMYLAATLLVSTIPRDRPIRASQSNGISVLRRAWDEMREGWHFAVTHRVILPALLQLALVSGLTMVMAVLAPGYAVRVLGLSPEDSIYVFWPAGAGMLLASIFVGRFGYHVPRQMLASAGMVVMGVALAGLAWAGMGRQQLGVFLFRGQPDLVIGATPLIMFFALAAGVAMAMINIPAQTVVQEHSSDAVRGRVMAVQFTLANLLGIPPLLFIGNLADLLGIATVTFAVAVLIVLFAGLNLAWARAPARLAPQADPKRRQDSRLDPPPPDTRRS
jgi:MFS family permease